MPTNLRPQRRRRPVLILIPSRRNPQARVPRLIAGFVAAIALVAMAAPRAAAADAPAQGATRPNIVFFFVDDMGWQDTSVPFHTEKTKLNELYRTPNMERLAADGVKFTQAYACAVCTPSRVSLMTGASAARHRVTGFTRNLDRGTDQDHRLVTPPKWNFNGLSAVPDQAQSYHAVTMPALLQEAGYRTIHVGKGHFGPNGASGGDPRNLGFDVNIAGHGVGGPGSYYGKHNFSAGRNRSLWDVPGLDAYHGKDINLTEALTIEANKAVAQAVADDKPFYLYFSHYAVHAPYHPDHRFLPTYEKMDLGRHVATFASMIESMDKSLGDVRANLEKLGVADNTIVVFMSDNGSPQINPRNAPLRGYKISPYEGGNRVPMIVHWPGVTQAASTESRYLMIYDVFPTFLEMGGVSLDKVTNPYDGVSIVPLLKRTDGYPNDRALYWHYPNTYYTSPYSSIRKGDYKLIYNHAKQNVELYNLAEDIHERKNLAEAQPERAQALAAALASHLRAVDAQMPTNKETGQPIPYPGSSLN